MNQPNSIRNFLFISLLVLGISILMPNIVQAKNISQPSSGITIIAADEPVKVRATLPSSDKKTYSNLSEYVKDFYIFAIWLITGISIIMIVYGGYTMIVSSGNPEMINKGKSTIISALVSLALLVLAYTVLKIISPQIITNPKPEATQTSGGVSGAISGSGAGFGFGIGTTPTPPPSGP